MNTTRGRIALAAMSFLFAAGTTHAQVSPAVADGTPEIDTAIAQHDWTGVLKQLDERVRSHPRDAQARFKRANVLAQLGRDDDAMTAYTALTQTYPELPEPYNNLAALYAKRGKLDEARVALETAVRASPGYALAQANLGDLYLRLAAESFKRASALDPRDAYSAQRSRQIVQLVSPPAHADARPGAADARPSAADALHSSNGDAPAGRAAAVPTTPPPQDATPNFPTIVPGTSAAPALAPYMAPQTTQP
ncbi:tetratricopeptide repeat protein [Mycetohabitans sp. B5]|uniref:Tetratricopeptide repeat protein n=1 Tax=Mycetohabitans endofungorum TaxID=417203 RepID=A0A2P5KB76_9BURK|nr:MULTISPECIES: tetratricopeptide repeat protein [Mycetohabitans]MCG1054871.1 tetratricopeptide repeat protein [Mycetohabitans sp. B5]PPB83947.1 tetratricopeptide repeat protein [Mycetohabitans endofungorum]